MQQETTRTERRLTSGPLMLMGIARERDTVGRPLDTFSVTMATAAPGAGVTVTETGIDEGSLRGFLEADMGRCTIDLVSRRDA